MAQAMRKRTRAVKKTKTDNTIVWIFLGIFIAILILSVILFALRHSDATILRPPTYDVSSPCTLSLCDCACYKTDELPEIYEQKLCGRDCRGTLGIASCSLVNETCIPKLIE